LFRYSALTFNAHLIHLDREYARNVEGHRNLLVHGPLSLTLMLQAMTGYFRENFKGQRSLESINYRNLAPLYCDEEMRICCLKKKSFDDADVYDVWIEGPTGGVAVKGTLRATTRPPKDSERGEQPPNVDSTTKSANTMVRSVYSRATRAAFDPQTRDSSKQKPKRSETSSASTPSPKPARFDTLPGTVLSGFAVPLVPPESITQSLSATTETPNAHAAEVLPQTNEGRNRSSQAVAPLRTSSMQSESTVRRVETPSSPMVRTLSRRARMVLQQRSARQTVEDLSVEPVSIVRTYRGRENKHDPLKVASKHSRYEIIGARNVGQTRIRISERSRNRASVDVPISDEKDDAR
jgi:hypothetical protein